MNECCKEIKKEWVEECKRLQCIIDNFPIKKSCELCKKKFYNLVDVEARKTTIEVCAECLNKELEKIS